MSIIDIIPAIDLLDGNVVRLHQGNYSEKTVYEKNAVSLFNEYIKQGAIFLHLVDLTGAKQPKARQINLINEIICKTKAKIQIGGGVRTPEDIHNLLNIGANRIVIGSIAIRFPDVFKSWLKIFGYERLVLAVDIKIDKNNNKKISINGWQEDSSKTLEQILDYFLKSGLKYVLCTDISRDGTGKGSNIDLYIEICKRYPTIDFQSSGGINSLNDIDLLKNTGIKAIIIGKALLDGKFTVQEAVLHVS